MNRQRGFGMARLAQKVEPCRAAPFRFENRALEVFRLA
jgi:hypothetical protein